MKKFLFATVLFFLVFSLVATTFLIKPQPAEGALATVANQVKEEIQLKLQYIKQLEEVKTALDILAVGKEAYKTATDIYGTAKQIYGTAEQIFSAGTQGILGYFGLGTKSQAINTFLQGTGLDQMFAGAGMSGQVGLGAILGGGLSGVMNPEDILATLFGAPGTKISAGTFKSLKDLGVIDVSKLLAATTTASGSAGACPAAATASGSANKTASGGSFFDNLYASAEADVINTWQKTLYKYGLALPPEKVKAMVNCGILDTKTLDKLAEPTPIELGPTIGVPLVQSCARYANDGSCMRTSSSFPQGKNGSFDIETDPAAFILRAYTWILGFAGAIALLLIIKAGEQIIWSRGKPEVIQQGKDQLTAAIVGLLFIILAFVLFEQLATDLLKIPGICKDTDKNCPQFVNPYKPSNPPQSGDTSLTITPTPIIDVNKCYQDTTGNVEVPCDSSKCYKDVPGYGKVPEGCDANKCYADVSGIGKVEGTCDANKCYKDVPGYGKVEDICAANKCYQDVPGYGKIEVKCTTP